MTSTQPRVTPAQRRVLAEIAERADGTVGSASSRTLRLLVDRELVAIDRTGRATLTSTGATAAQA